MALSVQQQIEYLREFDADSDIDNFSLNFMRPHVARCVRVIDGDTIVCICKFEFMVSPVLLHCRLQGCDTSETRGGSTTSRQLAHVAKEFLENLIGQSMLLLVFGKFDVFGRALVRVYTIGADNFTIDQMSLNDKLIAAGHAIEYNHGGRESTMYDGKRKNTVDDEHAGKTPDELIALYAKMNLGS